jgi:hypothetical protein
VLAVLVFFLLHPPCLNSGVFLLLNNFLIFMRFIRFSGAFAGTVGRGGVYLKHAAKCLSGSAENPDWACNLMKSVMFLAWGGGVWWNHAVAAEFYAGESGCLPRLHLAKPAGSNEGSIHTLVSATSW